jgi:hypothetical protein
MRKLPLRIEGDRQSEKPLLICFFSEHELEF